MAGSSETIVVLHVDDEPDFADLAADALVELDGRFEVVTANSAEAGLDRFESRDVDCVVSDFDMPGLDGIEFLEAVRDRRPDLPFVLFTGKGSEEVASEAISAGVTDYLQKEVGLAQYEVLANRVGNAVSRHRTRRNLDAQREQYRELFEEAPVMYAVTRNRQGVPVVEECNERFTARLGYAREDVVGEPLSSFYTDESRDELLEAGGYSRALEGEFTTERRSFLAAEGSVVETVLRAVPRMNDRGEVVGTLTLYLDRPAD